MTGWLATNETAPKPPAEESTTPPPADAPPPPAPAPSSEPDWAAEAQATLDAIAAAESDDALNAIWPSVVLHKADRPDVYKKLEAAWKLRRRELKAAAKAAEVRRWIVKCGDAYLGYVSAAGYGSACDEAGHLWPGAEITVIDVAEASEAQLLAADEAEKLAAQNATQA